MSISRQVFRSAAVYSGASVLEKIASFLLLPFYAHIFHTQGYGIIGLVDAAVGVLTIAFAAGFHTAIVRTYFEEPVERRQRVVSTAIVVVWLMGLVLVPIPMLASKWIAQVLLGDAGYWKLLVLALATLIIDIGGKSASTYLIIRQRSVLFSSIGLARMLLTISLNVLLVLVLKIGLIGIFISSLVTATLATSVYLFVALREQGLTFDREIARRLCAFQFPLVPAEMAAFISRQTERVLVRFFVSLSGAGVLEMAYKFPPMINMFFVAPFMLSWRTKSMELGEQPDAPRLMGRMLTAFTFLLLLGGLLLSVNIRPILILLTPPDFLPAAGIAQIDIVTTILAGLTTYMQFGIMYRKQTGRLAIIKGVVSSIKIAVSVFTIRTFGLSGAAYSALVTEMITLVWIARTSQSLYRIEIEYGRIALTIAAAATLFIGIEWVNNLPGGPLDSIASTIVPPLVNLIRHSPLAVWKSGKLLTFLVGHERAVAALVFNSLAGCCLAVLLPFLHPTALAFATGLAKRQRLEAQGTL